MQINVAVTDANNIVCEVVPPQTEVITIDRGVAGNGIVSIVPVTISTFQYLRITYTNGTVQDVGPLTSTAYTATAPITIVGNTISLATVPIASGGTDATTAAGAIQNLLPSYTGNANKRLGLNSLGTALEWVLDGGGTVTSVAASGGSTGLTFTGSPITTSGTLTLGGTLAIANGGTGATTAGNALTNLGAIGAITSTDGSVTITSTGTSRDLSVAIAAATNNVIVQVRNTTGSTLLKGTVVYISGATGQLPTVSKAIATGDSTSAQTLGMITADLANNSNGNVTVIGLITNIDTSAYTDGAQLYLSGTTAGAVTATKPYAPTHLVYVAVVEYAHPTQGKLFVKVQNGYELDEIHDVSIVSPVTGQTIVYNSSTSLWSNSTVSLTAGVNGTLPIANGGTGQITANAAFNALAPSQTGNSGKYLTTDGTDTSWATNPLGTVTSVAATVPSFLTISGSPITTSGTLAFGLSGTALPTTSGGTGLTSFTANGVVYASSTSALATGSALTYNGSTLGLYSTVAGLSIQTALNTNQATLTLADADGRTAVFRSPNSGSPNVAQIGTTTNHDVAFLYGNSEQMRLTSTGLGIGTSSPISYARLTLEKSGGDSAIALVKTGGAQTAYLAADGVNAWIGSSFGSTGKKFFVSLTAPDSAATLDSSGNLGLGVTPSAWSSGKAFEIGGAGQGIWLSGGNDLYYNNNAYYNSGWKYGLSGNYATSYRQVNGQHIWSNAPSGTAGNAISFTQAMTLDASGNLLVGGTLNIGYKSIFSTNSGGSVTNNLALHNGNNYGSSGTGTRLLFKLSNFEDVVEQNKYASIEGVGVSAYNEDTNLIFRTQSNGNRGNTPLERVRITQSGNVGIGTSSPNYKTTIYQAAQDTDVLTIGNNQINGDGVRHYVGLSLQDEYVNGTGNASAIRSYSNLYASWGSALTFWTTGTSGVGVVERARIDSSGNLMVGTAIAQMGGKIEVYSDIYNGAAGLAISTSDNTTGGIYAQFGNSAGTRIGSITRSGTSTVAYNTSSDYRLKENIVPMMEALAKVSKLKPVTYKWKEDGSEGQGFIAHELAEVCPHAVTGEKDAVDANGKPQYQGIDTSFLVATLTAAIQEQQAIIDSLKARLDAANL